MNTRTLARTLFLFTLAMAGCSPPAARADTDEVADAAAAAADADLGCGLHTPYAGDSACLKPPASGVQLHYGPSNYDDPAEVATYMLAPGDDETRCLTVDPIHDAMNVAGYEVSERTEMHHLTLYSGTAGTGTDPCAGSLGAVVLVQRGHEKITFGDQAPELAGAAVRLIPGAFVVAAHAINTGTTPELIEAWINLDTVDSTPVPLSSLSLAAGTQMAVPPHTKQTIHGSLTSPSATPETVVQLVGHFHAHTTEERVALNGTQVYSTRSFNEPGVSWFTSKTTPLVVAQGSTLTWDCDIDNTTDLTLLYAAKVQTAEMCNLTGFVRGSASWAEVLP
jgi:hypothetical protein